MGFFGSIGKAIKGVGKFALSAAPLAASFIPGVGPLAAGGAGLLSKIGGAIKNNPEKAIGVAGGVADFFGKRKQRKSAERYSNSMIDQRNQLLSQILAKPNYGLPNQPVEQPELGGGY